MDIYMAAHNLNRMFEIRLCAHFALWTSSQCSSVLATLLLRFPSIQSCNLHLRNHECCFMWCYSEITCNFYRDFDLVLKFFAYTLPNWCCLEWKGLAFTRRNLFHGLGLPMLSIMGGATDKFVRFPARSLDFNHERNLNTNSNASSRIAS